MLEKDHRFDFDVNMLLCVAGQKSVLDIPKLNIASLKEADRFIESYGFDLSHEKTVERLWYFYRRAFVLLTERLGYSISEIPETLRDRKHLKDIRQLLLFASSSASTSSSSSSKDENLKKWSCALLRCMHVYVHHESDLFHTFSEEIQKQILSPFEKVIFHDGTINKVYLRSSNPSNLEVLEISLFNTKAMKSASSSVIKLLAKPEAFTIRLMDHLGVRIVTKTIFDSFRVIRFLVNEGIVSYPQIISDQTTNNIYPIQSFMNTMKRISESDDVVTDQQIEELFNEFTQGAEKNEALFKKENKYSGEDHRFIKFICRKLIRIDDSENIKSFQFFFPYEVQIMDEKSYAQIQSGPAAHEEYKKRQNEAAKRRLFSNENF
ncbi:MAG TPA: TIGR04552 family protein [Pseudobdellovibrionaceae bacterium]|nr:TIGR04552 family protein [Pseudobdellovibrionaceae bacterium]